MEFPVGPETLKKAARTEPGKLAALLNRVLYSADAQEVPLEHGRVKRWVAATEVYRSDDPLPDGVSAVGSNDKYVETEKLMRAIRDYLEWRSFKDTIP